MSIFEFRFTCPACGASAAWDVTRAIPRRHGGPVEPRFVNKGRHELEELMRAQSARAFDIDLPDDLEIECVTVQTEKDPTPQRYTFVCELCRAHMRESARTAKYDGLRERVRR